MFKVSVKEEANGPSLYVEGRLAGPWVAELERCWRVEREQGGGRSKDIRVCLSGVTFIDDAGKALLAEMFQSGAKLEGKGCMTRAILGSISSGQDQEAESLTEPTAENDREFRNHQ